MLLRAPEHVHHVDRERRTFAEALGDPAVLVVAERDHQRSLEVSGGAGPAVEVRDRDGAEGLVRVLRTPGLLVAAQFADQAGTCGHRQRVGRDDAYVDAADVVSEAVEVDAELVREGHPAVALGVAYAASPGVTLGVSVRHEALGGEGAVTVEPQPQHGDGRAEGRVVVLGVEQGATEGQANPGVALSALAEQSSVPGVECFAHNRPIG